MCARVILSTDPGIDDAMAIIFLHKLNALEAIWTTMGNNSLENCTKNAVKILKLVGGEKIPLIKGSAEPILGNYRESAGVHGEDGLGDTNIPLPELSMFNWETIEYITSNIKRNPNEISIVSVGPLTNLAYFFKNTSFKIIKLIKQLIIMGGAIKVPGNVTPYAEFNIFSDPHAAEIVLKNGVPATLVGLDVTHQVIMKPAHIQELENRGTELTKFLAKIAKFYLKFHKGIDGCYLHDPLAAAVAIDPEIITKEELNIKVITDDQEDRGRTIVIDETGDPKISVALDVNIDRFMQLFLRTLVK